MMKKKKIMRPKMSKGGRPGKPGKSSQTKSLADLVPHTMKSGPKTSPKAERQNMSGKMSLRDIRTGVRDDGESKKRRARLKGMKF